MTCGSHLHETSRSRLAKAACRAGGVCRIGTASILVPLALFALVLGVSTVPSQSAAQAVPMIDQSKGKPGFCPTGQGVTVVVDFQQLGGEAIVRCNPTGKRGTGLDALKGAGFQIAGVQRWGEAFICRIENRPSATEAVPMSHAPDYRERCIDTPPAQAYWSYWHAGNNCAWTYSNWGVKNRDFTPGGFEGWSFSLNATAETNPQPRIAAVRPGTAGGRCTTRPEPKPTTNDPNERQRGSSADDGTQPDPDYGKDGKISDDPFDPDNPKNQPNAGGPAQGGDASLPSQGPSTGPASPGTSPGQRDLPAPKPRPGDPSVAGDPAENIAFSGGEDAPDTREVIKKEAGASDYAPWVAAGAMAVLAVLAVLTARKRRILREDA